MNSIAQLEKNRSTSRYTETTFQVLMNRAFLSPNWNKISHCHNWDARTTKETWCSRKTTTCCTLSVRLHRKNCQAPQSKCLYRWTLVPRLIQGFYQNSRLSSVLTVRYWRNSRKYELRTSISVIESYRKRRKTQIESRTHLKVRKSALSSSMTLNLWPHSAQSKLTTTSQSLAHRVVSKDSNRITNTRHS